ncbi:zinc finger protein 569-like [Anopheles marshallii]|uniref:zinc finger protein 569-like n=1 Tax=Anopheles marshallii TaxID=1521116 RepID=UPI00237AADAD|nr:zinc finger protein 569-like [Anopheles marshallii]
MDTQDLELSISAEEICRTCLAAVDQTQLKPIFCNEILDGRIVPFPSVLELVVGEQLVKHDKLPNNVCPECKGKLRELFLFIGTAQKSNKLLYEIFAIKPSNPVNARKNDIKHTGSQTEALEEKIKLDPAIATFPKPLKMNEIGTQCANETVEIACQTDVLPEPEKLNVQESTSKRIKIDEGAITPITAKEYEEASSQETDPLRESSIECTLMDFGDHDDDDDADENKYEMVLLANASNEEECFTLRPVKTDCKKKLIIETIPSKQLKRLKQGSLMPKSTIDCEQKRVSRRSKTEQVNCIYCNWSGRPAVLEQHFQIHKATFELCLESIHYIRCSDCFAVFLSQMHFIEHFCASCKPISSEEYVYHSDLQRHETFYLNGLDVCVPRLKTFKKISNKYHCGRCTKYTTNGFEAMCQHFLIHETEDDKTDDVHMLWKSNHLDKIHICGICNAQFPDATYIRQHLYFHQDSFICIFDCGMIFASFLRMTRHFEKKHMQCREVTETSIVEDAKAQDENYQCTQCEKTLSSADTLKNHLKNHYRSRKYVCTECNKSFGQKSDLTNHCRIHTDDRPYACKLCDKKFRTNSHLRDHTSTHEDVNKFECNVCHKMFKAKRILAGHVRLHTGEKPYQCKICNKSFSRKQHLITHQKIHFKPRSSGTASKPGKRTKPSP